MIANGIEGWKERLERWYKGNIYKQKETARWNKEDEIYYEYDTPNDPGTKDNHHQLDWDWHDLHAHENGGLPC